MLQFFCLHFIYFFGDRISLGWPQTFNSLASVSWVLRIQMCTTMASFFWFRGKACVERAWIICVPPDLSPVFWAECRATRTIHLSGRNMCWGPWPVKLSPLTNAKLFSLKWVKAKASFVWWGLSALAPDHSKWEMTKHPTPFWKWLHYIAVFLEVTRDPPKVQKTMHTGVCKWCMCCSRVPDQPG